jgi:hypothetical protein
MKNTMNFVEWYSSLSKNKQAVVRVLDETAVPRIPKIVPEGADKELYIKIAKEVREMKKAYLAAGNKKDPFSMRLSKLLANVSQLLSLEP